MSVAASRSGGWTGKAVVRAPPLIDPLPSVDWPGFQVWPPSVLDQREPLHSAPDNTFPSTATKVQNYFKISNIPSFDIQAVCSGFIYGIQIADSFIKSGKYNKILLIGAETLSKIIDWKDRRTCVLFGDGAGSLVISSSQKKNLFKKIAPY